MSGDIVVFLVYLVSLSDSSHSNLANVSLRPNTDVCPSDAVLEKVQKKVYERVYARV